MHLGNAIMSFYSALIDLLGRCAPEMHVSCLVASIPDLSNRLRKKKDTDIRIYLKMSLLKNQAFVSTVDPGW